MKIQKDKQFPTKLLIAAVIILLVGASLAYAYFIADVFSDKSAKPTDNSKDTTTNLTLPNEGDIEGSQSAKEQLINDTNPDSDTDNADETPHNNPNDPEPKDKKPVTIGISYVGITNDNLEIRAFSPSLVSGTGTCTATVSKAGSETITESVPAFIDASSTICQPINIPRSELSAGSWSVEVTFTSPTHQGSSGSTKVEVQ